MYVDIQLTHWLLVGVVVLGAAAILSAKQDCKIKTILTTRTALLVWATYISHGLLTMFASWKSLWSFSLENYYAYSIGLLLCVIGTYLYVAALVSFRTYQRMAGLQTDKLVTTGIYRWSRNPQNVGWILFLLGIAIAGKSGMALLLVVIFWVMFCSYLPIEERHLEKLYGNEWREYCKRASRFLGVPKNGLYKP